MGSQTDDWVVSSWHEFVELIEGAVESEEPMWFRGVGDANYKLIPSLFRHPKNLTLDSLLEMEAELIRRFRERSVPFRPNSSHFSSGNTMDQLLLMQHFGVPTRLLDWTENPHVALFFALTSAEFNRDTGDAESDVAIWALRPSMWNRGALSDMSFNGGVLSIDSPEILGYSPSDDLKMMRTWPVAMWGVHNSPRIVAQRGVFTIFGKSDDAMESICCDKRFQDGVLRKIVIKAEDVQKMLRTLTNAGMTDSTVYPDLGGLAMELKRSYGYVV